jgi:hypothetical protein
MLIRNLDIKVSITSQFYALNFEQNSTYVQFLFFLVFCVIIEENYVSLLNTNYYNLEKLCIPECIDFPYELFVPLHFEFSLFLQK